LFTLNPKGRTPQQLVELLVKHNPAASDQHIGDVVSEWGHLLEERPAQKVPVAPVKDMRPGHRKGSK
jgi:hypothetical protein